MDRDLVVTGYLAAPANAPRWKASTPPEGRAAHAAATAAIDSWAAVMGAPAPVWLGGMVGAVAKKAVQTGADPEATVDAALELADLALAAIGWWELGDPVGRIPDAPALREAVEVLYGLAVDGATITECRNAVVTIAQRRAATALRASARAAAQAQTARLGFVLIQGIEMPEDLFTPPVAAPTPITRAPGVRGHLRLVR